MGTFLGICFLISVCTVMFTRPDLEALDPKFDDEIETVYSCDCDVCRLESA